MSSTRQQPLTLQPRAFMEFLQKHHLQAVEGKPRSGKNTYKNIKLLTGDGKPLPRLVLPRIQRISIRPSRNGIPEAYLTPRLPKSIGLVQEINECMRHELARALKVPKKQTKKVRTALLEDGDAERITPVMKATCFKGAEYFGLEGKKVNMEQFKALAWQSDVAFKVVVRFPTGYVQEGGDKTCGFNCGMMAIAAVKVNEEEQKANEGIESRKRARENGLGGEEDGVSPVKAPRTKLEDILKDEEEDMPMDVGAVGDEDE
jgi:hypothetical protein